ncbi:hypothetical protein ABZ942_11785 [Nocardia sp. NPDC046473]|uniref:hypothetical protein n=1 Tax=unclassified Nocardia TaxID=2637762 RepID=UPI0033EB17EF
MKLDRRRPPGRGPRDIRSPGFTRPTVHPNPAGVHEKPWGGVMCAPRQERDER